MELDALQAFVAVAETQSFSRAGQRLFLSQPAISKRVAALESELGTPLFDRTGRAVRLTAAGRELLPRARRLMTDLADIRRHITNLSGEVGGTLTMGTSHHIGLRRLPPVLTAFHQRHAAVRLDIRFMDSEVVCEAVEKGELEMGIVTLPLSPPPRLRLEPLWDDPLETVVGKGHPLASADRLSLAELLAHTAVLPAPNTYTRAILQQALGAHAEELKVGMATNFLETLKMLATTGLGWTLLPRTMLGPDLRVLRVDGLSLHRMLGIATHRQRTLSNAAAALIDYCRSAAGLIWDT